MHSLNKFKPLPIILRMMKYFFALILFCSVQTFAKEIKVTLDKSASFLNLSLNKKNYKIDITLPKDMHVENQIQVIMNPDFNLLMIELSDYSSASTFVVAVNDQGQKLWEFNLGGFNPSTPLVEKDNVYFAVIGKVWKLTKQGGIVVWNHSGLYENKKYEFNGAEDIKRQGPWIEFSDKLKVNDVTGKIEETND